MIHYHGTPCGGKREDVARFLRGRHCLVPYGRTEDIETAALVCSSFIIDNGAFSAWKKREPITDWSGYYEFCERWHRHPGFDWALIPDVIGGSEDENDELLNEWPGHIDGVPVWHMHESIERLVRLSAFPRIAIGSSGEWPNPGTEKWWWRINEAMKSICDDGRPRCKIHGLRMLNRDIFTRIPISSADSTNAVRNGVRKSKQCGTNTLTGMVIIADAIEHENSSDTWKPISVPVSLF